MNGTSASARESTSGLFGQGRPVQYIGLRVRTLLRTAAEAQGSWHWAVNPYEGCEFGCTFCHARLDRKEAADWRSFEQRIRVKTNAVEAFGRDLRAEDFEERQVVLGTSSEPWQQAEEHFRVTRSLLEAMARADGVDLRINTRSSLIARDTDLLKEINRKGQVTVAFSIASMDEKVNRLMEPKAPSAFRRLAAMEALARAGVAVGLVVAPLFPGLEEDELGLETLVHRASNAGARFAGMRIMEFGPGQRENFLAHVTREFPDDATRFRRIIGRRAPTAEETAALAEQFEAACARHRLCPLHAAAQPRRPEPRRSPAEQLPLFGQDALS
jgi:DNA repair photolyase